jgi:hypothetical protein
MPERYSDYETTVSFIDSASTATVVAISHEIPTPTGDKLH